MIYSISSFQKPKSEFRISKTHTPNLSLLQGNKDVISINKVSFGNNHVSKGNLFDFVTVLEKNIDTLSKEDVARSFFEEKKPFNPRNYNDNPFLNIDTLAPEEEFGKVEKFLIENGSKGENERKETVHFFKDYLKTKAVSYHSKMKEFLEGINIEEHIKKSDSYASIKKAKEFFNDAIKYEDNIVQTFSNTSVIKNTELLKIQLKSSMINKPNDNKLSTGIIYKDLLSSTCITGNVVDYLGNYYENILLHFEDLAKDFTEKDLTEKKSNEKTIEDILIRFNDKDDDIILPKKNKKLWWIVGIAAVATAGITAYFINSNKKKKEMPENL